MTDGGIPKRGGLEVWLVALLFLSLGVGIVLYGSRDWMPPLASRHGAGVDHMLTYLLLATGCMLLVAFTVLACLVWLGGRRGHVARRLAAHRTELTVSLALGLLMAAVAEGGVLAIGLPVWNEYFFAATPPNATVVDVTAQQFLWNVRSCSTSWGFKACRGGYYSFTTYEYLKQTAGQNEFISIVAFILMAGQVLFAVNFVWSLFAGRVSVQNPWQSTTLEWGTSSPPPHGNFVTIPTVHRWPYEYSVEGAASDFTPQTVPAQQVPVTA